MIVNNVSKMNKSNKFPWLKNDISNLPFVILDLETTGIDPFRSEITEIAIITAGSLNEEMFHTLINPQILIPEEITRITGITNEMVQDKPKIYDVLPLVEAIISNAIFVSHNVMFDLAFFDVAFQKYLGKKLNSPYMCTLELSRRLLKLPSHNLSNLAQHFGIKLECAHRALYDTIALKEIFIILLSKLKEKGIMTGEDLCKSNFIKFR